MSHRTLLTTAPVDCLVYETTNVRSALVAAADAVRVHPHAICVQEPRERIHNMLTKFVLRYPELLRNKDYAYRHRRAGGVTHKLIIYHPPGEKTRSIVILMASAPDEHEKWQDVRERKSRLKAYDYELVRVTKEGQKNPSWTWRIVGTKYDATADAIKIAIKFGNDAALKAIIEGTKRWAGFHEVRNQHYKLGVFMRKEWEKKSENKGADPPPWPRLPYVTRRNAARTPEKRAAAREKDAARRAAKKAAINGEDAAKEGDGHEAI